MVLFDYLDSDMSDAETSGGDPVWPRGGRDEEAVAPEDVHLLEVPNGSHRGPSGNSPGLIQNNGKSVTTPNK